MLNWPIGDWLQFLAALGAFVTGIIHAIRSSAKKDEMQHEITLLRNRVETHEENAASRAVAQHQQTERLAGKDQPPENERRYYPPL